MMDANPASGAPLESNLTGDHAANGLASGKPQHAMPKAGSRTADTARNQLLEALVLGDIAEIEVSLAENIDLVSSEGRPSEEQPGEAGTEDLGGLIPGEGRNAIGSGAPAPQTTSPLATAPEDDLIVDIDIDMADIARAIGIENLDLISTMQGQDLVAGLGAALGVDSAEAFGILNKDVIRLRADRDQLIGVASATGLFDAAVDGRALAFGYSGIDNLDEPPSTARLRTSSGADEVTGVATARGTEEVEAFGLLFRDAGTRGGSDEINGTAIAEGLNVARANGIAIGISNSTENDGGTLIADQAGVLLTGSGGDVLTAIATAETATDGTPRVASGADDNMVIVADANADSNGVLVDIGSTLDLGSGANEIDATGTAIDTGGGAENIFAANLAVTADGIENRGDILAGNGRDMITGTATASSEGGVLLTVTGGIDNGFGAARANIPDVIATMVTGDGNDRVTGTGVVAAMSGIGLASGIETNGLLDTGLGDDAIEGTGISSVTDGLRSVSDGIENATLNVDGAAGLIDMGDGDDQMIAMAQSEAFGGVLGESFDGELELIGTEAEAIGIRNDFEDLVNDPATNESRGTVDLGAGINTLTTSAAAFSELGKAFAFGLRGGTVNGGDDGNTLEGTASAIGGDDAGAFGLSFTDASFGAGNEVIAGIAEADGKGSSEVRGVAVGASDVDDDVTEEGDIVPRIGTVDLGAGDDTVTAIANLTIEAGEFDQVFFGGANGIIVDGPAEAEFVSLFVNPDGTLKQIAVDLAVAALSAERFDFTNLIQGEMAKLTTSTLRTGDGEDTLNSDVAFRAFGDFAPEDDDLEYIADAVENAGILDLGADNDTINITMEARSDTEGAKMLVDPLDNSSVGLISGYAAILQEILGVNGANLLDTNNDGVDDVAIDVEVNDNALFDLGEGDDRITSNTFATALDDLSAGDGLGNRGLWVGGNGSETLDLTTVSLFRLGEVKALDDGEQREAIADGWESRRKVFLDDVVIDPGGTVRAGDTAGDGDDFVKADATAFGNGVLTIADGVEAREFTDTGAGDDHFDLTARAFTTEVDLSQNLHADVLAQNITVATGLMTEQVDEGDFFMRDGNDVVEGSAFAAPAVDLDPEVFVGADFDVSANDYVEGLDLASLGAGFVNRATIAQGISQVSGDADNDGLTADPANPDFDPTVDLGDIDTGAGNDTLNGEAVAVGVSDVRSYGILLTQASTGGGGDTLAGTANAVGLNAAFGNGIAVGVSRSTDNNGVFFTDDQAGTLVTGSGDDVINAVGSASTSTDGTARVTQEDLDGTIPDGAVVSDANADANGVLVDLGSSIELGSGSNTVTGTGSASDDGNPAGNVFANNLAVTADGVENRGTITAGNADDFITGTATARSEGGVLLTVTGGVDNGFGAARANIDGAIAEIRTGGGNDELTGTSEVIAESGIGLSSGIETNGLIMTGGGDDILEGNSRSTVSNGIRAVADGIENATLNVPGAQGLINTGQGNDTLNATATAIGEGGTDAEAIAIRNDFDDLVNDPPANLSAGTIQLAQGDDTIVAHAEAMSDGGVATAIGIRGGVINAGLGNDSIVATSNVGALAGGTGFGNAGLGNDLEIDMGAGDDFVLGFGDAVISGGDGQEVVGDELAFAFSMTDFLSAGGTITFGTSNNEVDFALGGEVLETDRFELFTFDGQTFAFDDPLLVV